MAKTPGKKATGKGAKDTEKKAAKKKAAKGAETTKLTSHSSVDKLRDQLEKTKRRLKKIDPEGRNEKIVEIIKRIESLLEVLSCQFNLTKVF